MYVIQGKERDELEELVRQLRTNGPGGGSAALTAAINKFGAFTTHDLAVKLALRLLGAKLTDDGSGGCDGFGLLITGASMGEEGELKYMRGSRAALLGVIGHCLRQLGYEDPEAKRVAWVKEREATVEALRSACERHGDNDWSDDLHLSDVVEKHLARHLAG